MEDVSFVDENEMIKYLKKSGENSEYEVDLITATGVKKILHVSVNRQ